MIASTTKESPTVMVALTSREIALFLPNQLQDRLRSLVPSAIYVDPQCGESEWRALCDLHRPQILITGWATQAIPINSPQLRYICHVAGSVRRQVPRELLERGVVVSNWGAIVAETVAEAALGMIIAALRRTQEFGDLMHRQKGWEWAPNRTLSLFDRRVGIHGFGLVVRRLLPLLKSFRCPVMIYAAGVPESWFAECNVRKASTLEELFDWSDVVIEAEALTPSNHEIINEKLLRRLHPGDVFVNIARGGLVDEAALAAVAADSKIRVALDVFQEEPLSPSSPLRGMPHVLLTPHVAGPTEDRYPMCGEQALNNLDRYLRGDCIDSKVTLSIYDRST